MTKVAIIDYHLGNLRSVENALEFIGAQAFIAKKPAELLEASHIILPGVGAFGEGMELLQNLGWVAPLKENVLDKKKPFLGICLGMQLCADIGMEHGQSDGLGFIGGIVERLEDKEPDIRVPHIGWNTVKTHRNSDMFKNAAEQPCFYFVHSYAIKKTDKDVLASCTEHGRSFISACEKENIWCVQFHPEKSQKDGLHLLKNFIKQ